MSGKVKEIVAIFMAILWAAIGAEDGRLGAEKKAEVVEGVLKELEDSDGISLKGFMLDAAKIAVPIGVNLAVKMLHKFGVFGKSS